VKETPQKAFGNDTPESHTADSAKLSWRNNASWKQFSIVGLPPKTIILLMVLSIFVGELIVMFILHLWPELPVFTEALINALILVLIISPTLILFHYRPMVSNLRQRDSILGQLVLSEERLNLALQAVNDGLWDCNVQTGEIYFTPRFATMLGYSPDEIKPTFDGLKNLVHPEDRDLFDNAVNESLHSQGKYLRVEVRLKCRTTNPEWLWVLIRGNVVKRATDGSPLRAVGTNTNIHERKQAEAALHQSEEGIRSLSRQLINNSEAEKKRLAHELHDDIGQMITAFKMGIEMIRSQNVDKNPEFEFHCDRLLEIGNRMNLSLHEICDNLRPAMLDDLGLFKTIEWLTDRFSEQHSDIHTRVELPESSIRLPEQIELVCYRVCQEALNNISKHACPTIVDVALTFSDDHLKLNISDNGRGFDSAKHRSKQRWGIGLLGIKERATGLGGTATIESSPGNGTRISVELPLAAEV
jgi:two-component system sensor histidine kinase UhpB